MIAPRIGNFHGYSFKGTANHIFLTTYKSILKILKRDNKARDIFLDITHGINYHVTAVLYATISALLSHDLGERMEERLYIINSEPYPPGYRGVRCLKGDRIPSINEEPSIEILDLTELHNAIRALRVITNIIKLDERPLDRYIKSLSKNRDKETNELREKLNELIKFFKYLRLGQRRILYYL